MPRLASSTSRKHYADTVCARLLLQRVRKSVAMTGIQDAVEVVAVGADEPSDPRDDDEVPQQTWERLWTSNDVPCHLCFRVFLLLATRLFLSNLLCSFLAP